jgi:hypothetical protein
MTGMETMPMPTEARATARALIELLQTAHFMARDLEQYVVVADPRDRLTDRIHAVRVLAEHLRCA